MFPTKKEKKTRDFLIKALIEEVKVSFLIIKVHSNSDYSGLAEIFSASYSQRIKQALYKVEDDHIKYLLNSHYKQYHILYLMHSISIIDESEYFYHINKMNVKEIKYLQQENNQRELCNLIIKINPKALRDISKSITDEELAKILQESCKSLKYYKELMSELNKEEQRIVSELLEYNDPSTNLSMPRIKEIDTAQREMM